MTHALSVAGDALVTTALAGSLFFSISPTAARGRVALSLVLTMAPFAIVAPLLGPAIDASRRGRRGMVLGSCAGRSMACLAMAQVIDGLLLFPAALGALVLSKGYSVAKSALVPSAVGRHAQLVEANSRLAVAGVVLGLAAAVPGVLVLRLFGAVWVLRIATAVFAAAAIASVRIVERATDDCGPSVASGDESVRPVLGLASAAVAMAVLRALVGFLTFLVAFSFRRAGAPTWWFGVVLAASMGGNLAGAGLAPRMRTRMGEERIIAVSLGVVALVALAVARLEGMLWATAVAASLGAAAGAAKLAFDAVVQRDAPGSARGRSFARYEAGFQLVWVVGALLPVVVITPLRQGFDVIGIAALAAGVAYFAFFRRVLNQSPRHAPPDSVG